MGISTDGSIITFTVDGSWGSDTYGKENGGVQRRKFKFDKSSEEWWDIHPD